jgi:phenylalanyl-tRNA synthetase beta chain
VVFFLLRYLERSGIRPISAVVDVSNYVMLEMGQPLHAYDDAHLEGAIVVRFARAGEKLTLLNGEVLDLDPSLLLVADAAKPLGLAGIMGGEHSSISDGTSRVYLEGAFGIRGDQARRRLVLPPTRDRFERRRLAASWLYRRRFAHRAIRGGRAGPPAMSPPICRARPGARACSRINGILGVDVPVAEVAAIFERLGLAPHREGDDFIVTPPSYRFDLAIEADLIEEVARLYGFDRIETAAPAHRQRMLPAPERRRSVSQLRARLVGRDYQEVITFSFVSSAWERAMRSDPPPIAVLNPIASHLDVMRTPARRSDDVLRTNVNRKPIACAYSRADAASARRERLEQPPRIAGLIYGRSAPAVEWRRRRSTSTSRVTSRRWLIRRADHARVCPCRGNFT